MANDHELMALIKNSILCDERLSYQPIDVVAEKGIVTLSGTVQSYRRKLAAYELVSSLEGCRDVINKLVVKPPQLLPDQEIADNVRAALDSHADITKEAIVVSVKAGVADLNGNVGSQWERILGEDVARAARGVNDINNYLVVNLPEREENEKIEQAVHEAFSHTRGLKENKISIAVSGGLLVLSGEVDTLMQKEMAERVAYRFSLREIRNEIVVSG